MKKILIAVLLSLAFVGSGFAGDVRLDDVKSHDTNRLDPWTFFNQAGKIDLSTLTSTVWVASATEKVVVLPQHCNYFKIAVRPDVAGTCFVDVYTKTGDGSKNNSEYATSLAPVEKWFKPLGTLGGTIYLDVDGNVNAGMAGTSIITITYALAPTE